ncbi:MAG: hypothetical protein ACOYL6_13550 [Bacteriovoracaceae bacterium]
MSDKQKKKLTKKELKAQNHAKLMSHKGGGGSTPQTSSEQSNVIQFDQYKNKKAA